MSAERLSWHLLRPGWYEATDVGGTRWRIRRFHGRRWEVYENDAAGWTTWARSLAYAKWYVESEVAGRLEKVYR